MTVHIHRSVGAVGFGEHTHVRPDTLMGPDGEGRTWSFDCKPACEARVVKDLEFAAGTANGVPLTQEEQADKAALSEAAQRDVSKLAMALSHMADREAAGQPV